MKEQAEKTSEKPKGFLKSLIEKLDKKLKTESDKSPCCSPKSKDSDKPSCCS